MLNSVTTFADVCSEKGIPIIPTWYHYIERAADETGRCGLIFNFPDDLGLVALAVVEILLRVAALVAIGFVIAGGFKYITSEGEPERAKSAQQSIVNALIGLAIALLATGIVAFIGGQLTK